MVILIFLVITINNPYFSGGLSVTLTTSITFLFDNYHDKCRGEELRFD